MKHKPKPQNRKTKNKLEAQPIQASIVMKTIKFPHPEKKNKAKSYNKATKKRKTHFPII